MTSNDSPHRAIVAAHADFAAGLASAVQQVERTERVLKSLWREHHQSRPGWIERYRRLEAQSEQVLRTGLIILENLLA